MTEHEWTLTDPDSFQIVRNLQNGEYDIWKVVPFGDEWAAVNAYINLDDYILDDVFAERYLKPCGFESLEDVYCFEDSCRLIAECIFDIDLPLFGRAMVGTRDKCIEFIKYVEDLDTEQ